MSYHEYVFDEEEREFRGDFEEMYRAEDREGFDSWHCSDLTHVMKQLSLTLLGQYNFDRIFCYGCGKGHFAHLLKRRNNYVLGVDVAPTAIRKARTNYGHLVDFEVIEDNDFESVVGDRNFDLTVAAEVLSYVEEWREVIGRVAGFSRRLYVSLYLPEDPIGFVKGFDELEEEVARHFELSEKLLYNDEVLCLLGVSREQDSTDDEHRNGG